MDDFMNSFFFDLNRPPPAPKAKDQVVDFDVTLEDLYNGKSVHFAIEKDVICKLCSGSGGKKGAKPQTCGRCSGKGHVLSSRQLGPGLIAQMPSPCPACEGEGVKIKDKSKYVLRTTLSRISLEFLGVESVKAIKRQKLKRRFHSISKRVWLTVKEFVYKVKVTKL